MMNNFFHLIGLIGVFYFLSGTDVGVIHQPIPEVFIQNINSGWQYLENNMTDVSDLKNQQEWRSINLPHTWNQWDAVDITPGYRRDASWYQKKIIIENYKRANFLLYFEGVNITADIYVNEKFAGRHVGGYVGFEIDITPYVKKGQRNLISIRVDNGYNPNVIPSQKADFFIYGGITRDVWLKIVPDTYIENVFISTHEVSNKSAASSMEIQFKDPSILKGDYWLKNEIIDKESGEIVAQQTLKIDEKINEHPIELPSVKQPKLWSPEHPNLYRLTSTVLLEGRPIVKNTEIFGFRYYEFKPNGAFLLNGKRVLLRGTHRHEEHAGYGAAMPNELHRKDIEQIKEMGANFIRLAHYPQDPEIYKTCDELGLIVWDELPWCRGGMGGEEWEANTARLLKEQIRQNYNHPSIFFWSLGNEIYWLPDFENGDDEKRMNSFVKKLNDVAHQMDANRMTAIRKYYAGADLVDVFSPSIWAGWYAGVYANYENTLNKSQNKYPRFLHMEYGGSSHVGRHTENPVTGKGLVNENDWTEAVNQVNVKNIAKNGDWTENYIVDLFDWHLGVSEQQNNFAGNAQWAFKDFGTPLRPENAIPYLNQKGLVDRAGNPKDAYYVFKSYWAKEPFTYIESHTWTNRTGPKGKKRNISVFSNCSSVELFKNGKSLGVKGRNVGQFPACGLNWDLHFLEGKTELVAKGNIENGGYVYDTIIVNYTYVKAGKAHHISLNSHVLPNGNYLIEAIMMDANEHRVLDYEKPVYFSRDGAGELLKNYGTPTRSQVIQMANGRAVIELRPSPKGKAVVEVRNQDFKGSYLEVNL